MRSSAFTTLVTLMSAGAAQAQSLPAAVITPPFPVVVEYDAAFDRTVVQVDPLSLDSMMTVSALVALVGPRPATRSAGGVVLTFHNGRQVPLAKPTIRLELADGIMLDLGNGWSSPMRGPGNTEIVFAGVDLPHFVRFTKSASSALHIGEQRYQLTEWQMNALRGFVTALGPAAGP